MGRNWFVKEAKGNSLLAIRRGRGITWQKTFWIWPWESYVRVDLEPVVYEFDMFAVSKDQHFCPLHVQFLVGPDETHLQPFTRYTSLLFSHGPELSGRINEGMVWCNVERSTRVLVSSLAMEAVLDGVEELEKNLIQMLGEELCYYGLRIYSGRLKSLKNACSRDYKSNGAGTSTQDFARNPKAVTTQVTTQDNAEEGGEGQHGKGKEVAKYLWPLF